MFDIVSTRTETKDGQLWKIQTLRDGSVLRTKINTTPETRARLERRASMMGNSKRKSGG